MREARAGEDRRHGHQERSARAALGNGHLVRYSVSVLLNIVAEWGVYVGVLVLAFDRAGSTTAGLAAIALVVPNIVFAPLAGAMSERHPAQRVRITAMAVQAAGLGGSALAAYADLHIAAVVAPAMVAIAGSTLIRPACAVLRPAIVRSSRELTVSNLWVSYADSVSVFAGPLVATAAIALGGPEAAIATCALLSLAGLVVALVRQPVDPPSISVRRGGVFRLMQRHLATLPQRPGVLGVLVVTGASYFLVGSFDILLVVAANEEFGLGPSGAGALVTAVGAGSLLSGAAVTGFVRRRYLGPIIAAAIVVLAIGPILIGLVPITALAFVVLPVIGLARSAQDHLGQILLQRSTEPGALGPLFAMLELVYGLGLLAGSLTAQLLILAIGVRAAFVGTGVFFVVLLALTARSLRAADSSADVPVVAMSLLRRSPVFTPLPVASLEVVARSATEVDVTDGQVVIRQGDAGETYYVVADGTFVITVDDREVARCERGDGFGELALLADAPRAATVTAAGTGALLAVERTPFLIAVTGHDSSRQAAWGVMRRLSGDAAPISGPEAFPTISSDDDTG